MIKSKSGLVLLDNNGCSDLSPVIIRLLQKPRFRDGPNTCMPATIWTLIYGPLMNHYGPVAVMILPSSNCHFQDSRCRSEFLRTRYSNGTSLKIAKTCGTPFITSKNFTWPKTSSFSIKLRNESLDDLRRVLQAPI